jgi:hypothetical protein
MTKRISANLRLPLFLVALLFAMVGLAQSPEVPSTHKLRDEGRLDPAWFGKGLGEFRSSEKDDREFDYLWVKAGFSFSGHKLRVTEWDAPRFIGKERRDSFDLKFAEKLTQSLPKQWSAQMGKQLEGIAQVSPDEGDLVMTGRIVDCSGPRGFGPFTFSNITFDIKITDAVSGDLLVAFHNRKTVGSDMELDELNWIKDFAKFFKDPAKLYAEGELSRGGFGN